MKTLIPLIAAVCLLSGCGYVLHGSTQKVSIDTVPTGARVEVDGRSYTTPAELELGRGTHHTVTARTTAGAPLATHIRSEIQWRWAIPSFFLPPIIGSIIDGVSGGDSELVPDKLVIPLGTPS